MTDKEQIMINGVDVSKCSHYNPLGNYNCGGIKKCSQWSNCYFKQLARKTQECERMRYYLNKIRQNELSSLDIEWDEYITECDCTDYSNIITYVEYGLGERIINHSNTVEEYCSRLANKEKECEELKAEKEVIKKYLGISDKSIMQRLEELTEYKLKRQLKYIKIEEERDRYRNALEEIDGIVKDWYKNEWSCYMCRKNMDKKLEEILDIINKTKGK